MNDKLDITEVDLDYLCNLEDCSEQRAHDIIDDMAERHHHDEVVSDQLGLAAKSLRSSNLSNFHEHMAEVRRRLMRRER